MVDADIERDTYSKSFQMAVQDIDQRCSIVRRRELGSGERTEFIPSLRKVCSYRPRFVARCVEAFALWIRSYGTLGELGEPFIRFAELSCHRLVFVDHYPDHRGGTRLVKLSFTPEFFTEGVFSCVLGISELQ